MKASHYAEPGAHSGGSVDRITNYRSRARCSKNGLVAPSGMVLRVRPSSLFKILKPGALMKTIMAWLGWLAFWVLLVTIVSAQAAY